MSFAIIAKFARHATTAVEYMQSVLYAVFQLGRSIHRRRYGTTEGAPKSARLAPLSMATGSPHSPLSATLCEKKSVVAANTSALLGVSPPMNGVVRPPIIFSNSASPARKCALQRSLSAAPVSPSIGSRPAWP